GDNYSNISAEDGAVLTNLKTDSALRQIVIDNLIELQRKLIEDEKLTLSSAVSKVDGKCYRTNIYLYGTEAIQDDVTPYGGGGAVCEGDKTKKLPYLRGPHAELIDITQPGAAPTRIFAHEYTHALQCAANRGLGGWSWYVESFANYIGNKLGKRMSAMSQLYDNFNWSLDNEHTRYGAWPWHMFINKKFGPNYTADIFERVKLDEESLFDFMRRTLPFDCEETNINCRNDGMANLYAEYANSLVNSSYISENHGYDVKPYAYNSLSASRYSAPMEKLGDNHYRVQDWVAPQRFGHNMIELIPDPDNRILSINFDGWTVEKRDVQYRLTVVATLDDSVIPVKEAFGETFESGTQTIDLDAWENTLGSPIKKLNLVVAAVPGKWRPAEEVFQYTYDVRFRELDRFVYELKISGAWPLGHEPASMREEPIETGSSHPNGGGFVASTATVASTAYVAPEARVLGNAQVSGTARIEGRAIVGGTAIIQDEAIVSSESSVRDNVRVSGWGTVRDRVLLLNNVTVDDEAKIQGNSSYYGTYNTSGKGMTLMTPMLETTSSLTVDGTAISNGHTWMNSGTVSLGSDYDKWLTDDMGLMVHYRFNKPHDYRIEETHIDADAYYLGENNKPLPTGTQIISDTELGSNVLQLDGKASLNMPKFLLDQLSYQLSMKFLWQQEKNTTQTLLDAKTDRGEQIILNIIPTTGSQFELQLTYVDKDTNTVTTTLSNTLLAANIWLDVTLSYDNINKNLKISASPEGLNTPVESSLTTTYDTRQFDYDTLKIRIGGSVDGDKFIYGKLDDIRVSR
ncbi:MAG: DUF6055 domain-containing protein, partial [Gammaproteobacteria bacterium]|nr:DUF6055 domain-containing protein [Gammaproteobacteria bacterium]